MTAKIVSFTHNGAALCARLLESLSRSGEFEAEGYAKEDMPGLNRLETDIKSFAKDAFENCGALIFIGAAGIAVRAVAPFLKSKSTDPAVIVIDELGKYVIPILSGHMGRANSLASQIAGMLGAAAIITTATDINCKFAADIWAIENDCRIYDISMVKDVSAAVLAGRTVGFLTDFTVDGEYPEGLRHAQSGETGICVSLDVKKRPFARTLNIVPRCVTVGIGCRKALEPEILEERFINTLKASCLPLCAVSCIATIDIKSEEKALLALCEKYGYLLKTYSARELEDVKGNFTASDFVKNTTGVDNVCERAAVKASGGELILCKNTGNGVTIAAAKADWRGKFEYHHGGN